MSNSKEAIAIVLDIGPSMCKLGGGPSYLQQACYLVTLILQRKLFSESKDEISLIFFGTEKSKNDLSSELGGYNHVSVDTAVSPVTFELIEQFKQFVKPEVTHSADFLDALIVSMNELKQKTGGVKKFVGKRIILVSALAEAFSNKHSDDVVASFQEHQFDFTYLGPEEERLDGKEPAMKLVTRIIDAVEGDQFTFQEVYPCLSTIQSRSIRPTAWKATLTIATSLQIPICMYIKVKEYKARNFSKAWLKEPDTPLQRSTSYHLDSTVIDKADVIDGNKFGTTLIPFSAEDKKALKGDKNLKSDKCFKVLGFTKLENVKRHQYFGDSVWVCMAEANNKAAQITLSSLMRALHETSMVAIVRRVPSARSSVQVGCLLPHLKNNSEIMYYIQLPFFEDIRQSPFRPLPLEANSTHQYAFSEEQLNAVNGLIDSLNLSKTKANGGGGGEEKKEEEEEEEEEELFKAHKVYNPYLQRLYQCLEHRALQPEDPSLPAIPADVQSLLQLPDHKVLASKPAMDRVKELFKVVHQEVEHGPKVEGTERKAAGAGATAEEFKAILTQSVLPEPQALNSLLAALTSPSIPPPTVLECLSVLRKHHLSGGRYSHNDLLRSFKKHLLTKGDSSFWLELSKNNVGLVTKGEAAGSEVSEEEAKHFMTDFMCS